MSCKKSRIGRFIAYEALGGFFQWSISSERARVMWEFIEPPIDKTNPCQGEASVERCVIAKMQEYDGTIFFCCSPADKERVGTFIRAARATGRQVRDVRQCCAEVPPQTLAKAKGKQAIFVRHSQQEYLSEYLAVCPAGERHLVLYSRRHGNGPSPHMSAFMDFWAERDVDIWDLRDIDGAIKAGEQL